MPCLFVDASLLLVASCFADTKTRKKLRTHKNHTKLPPEEIERCGSESNSVTKVFLPPFGECNDDIIIRRKQKNKEQNADDGEADED